MGHCNLLLINPRLDRKIFVQSPNLILNQLLGLYCFMISQSFGLNRRSSFNQLESWLNELQEYGNQGMVILIIGNKADKENE